MHVFETIYFEKNLYIWATKISKFIIIRKLQLLIFYFFSYRRLNSDTYSSNLRGSSVTSSTGRPLITSVPAYDKYGKELSNYERWKLQQAESSYSSSASDSRCQFHQRFMCSFTLVGPKSTK